MNRNLNDGVKTTLVCGTILTLFLLLVSTYTNPKTKQTDSDHWKSQLTNLGYTNIKLLPTPIGTSFVKCGSDDAIAQKFEAQIGSANVKAVACEGIFKNLTVRADQ